MPAKCTRAHARKWAPVRRRVARKARKKLAGTFPRKHFTRIAQIKDRICSLLQSRCIWGQVSDITSTQRKLLNLTTKSYITKHWKFTSWVSLQCLFSWGSLISILMWFGFPLYLSLPEGSKLYQFHLTSHCLYFIDGSDIQEPKKSWGLFAFVKPWW